MPVEFVLTSFNEATPGQNHSLTFERAEHLVEMFTELGISANDVGANGLGTPSAHSHAIARNVVRLDTDTETVARIDTTGLTFNGRFVTPEASPIVDEIVAALRAAPTAHVELVMYASTGAGSEVDHAVSHERGDGLFAELVRRGVDPAQLGIVGMGAEPIPDSVEDTITVIAGPDAALPVALGAIELDDIDFDVHTATLTAVSLPILDRVASVLLAHPHGEILVASHTFTEPTSEANHILSHRQAEALADFLVAKGIDRSRLILAGHGDPRAFEAETENVYVTFNVMH